MATKGAIDYFAATKALVTLIVGILVSIAILGIGWEVFARIAPDLVEGLGETGRGILAGGVMVAVGLIMAATILAARHIR